MPAIRKGGVPRHYVTLSYMFGLFDYLQSIGHSPAPVLAAIGLTQADLEDGEQLLPADHIETAFRAAEALTGDASIGFHAGPFMRLGHLGMVGHLLLCCESPEALLQMLCRYSGLISNCMRLDYERANGQVIMRQYICPEDRQPDDFRHTSEFSHAGWITICRWMGGTNLAADFTEFAHRRPEDTAEMRAFAGCDLTWEAPETRAGFSEKFLQHAFLLADSGLKAYFEAALRERQQLLQNRQQQLDPLVAKVRQLIADRLMHGTPELREIATAAGETARRLQYSLEGRQTSFKQLVDEVRKEVAAQYIRDRQLSLIEVALMLGFSDQSTFQRAFKRWYGIQPGEWRRQLSTT